MNQWGFIFGFDLGFFLSGNFAIIFNDLNGLNLEIIQSCNMNQLIRVGAVSFQESFKNNLAICVFGNILYQHVPSLVFPRLVLYIDAVNGSDQFVEVIRV